MEDTLTTARSRARHWLRIFGGLVKVLDRLDERKDSPLARSLLFLLNRSLGHLEPEGPFGAEREELARQKGHDPDRVRSLDLLVAVEFVNPNGDSGRSERVLSDELQMLLALSTSLLEEGDEGRFADPKMSGEEVAAEYHALRQVTPDAVLDVTLFPLALRRRWRQILGQLSEQTDPLRRLGLEMSLMRVVRSLYAMALGFRTLHEAIDANNPARETLLAFTVGDASLGQGG